LQQGEAKTGSWLGTDEGARILHAFTGAIGRFPSLYFRFVRNAGTEASTKMLILLDFMVGAAGIEPVTPPV